MSTLINVKLSRFDGSPWGFRLQGGKDFGQPLVIQKVAGGSLAEKAGLQAGDAVIKVNATDLYNLRHKEAQDSIVRAGNTFELTVQRGGAAWKPQVTPVGTLSKPNASAPMSNIQPVTKTSLAARKTEAAPIGSGHNLSARPFGTIPQVNGTEPIKAIVNKQYNTPVGMYSEETIAETLSAQAEVLAGGVLGVNFKKNERNYDAAKSEVFKMLQEIDKEPHEPEPGSSKENGICHLGGQNCPKPYTPPRTDSPDSGKSNHSSGSSTKTNYVQSQTFLRLQAALDEGEDPEVNAALGSRGTGVFPLAGLRHVSAPETKAPSSDQPSSPYAVPKTSLPPGQNICADCERLIVKFPARSMTPSRATSPAPQKFSSPYPSPSPATPQPHMSPTFPPSTFYTSPPTTDIPAPSPIPMGISPVPPGPRPLTPQPEIPHTQPNEGISCPSPAPGSTAPEVPQVDIRCSGCESQIVGVFVRIKDKNLHVECFKCATCGTSLKNVGYYNINNKLYCDIHAKLVARHHPPAPNLEPVTVPPGGKAPAGAISAAVAHSMVSPGGPGTPTPLATTQLSPQPGTMAPLPFHPTPPSTATEQSETDYQCETAKINGQNHVESHATMKIAPENNISKEMKETLQENNISKEIKETLRENNISKETRETLPETNLTNEISKSLPEHNLSKEYQAPRVGTSHVHAPRPIAQSPAASAPKPFSSVSAPAPSTSVSRPTSGYYSTMKPSTQGYRTDYIVSTLRDSVEKKEYPHCESCGNQIPRGPFITALGKTWCPDHFVCVKEQCRRPLQDIGFVEEQGQLYCEYCFEKFLAPTCNKCQSKVKGDCLNAIGQHFHPECFSCAYCGKLFGNNPFFLEDGLPYCEADWNELFTTKCFACGFPIEAGDRWVEALNNNYHSQCFNCSMCKKNLEGQSFYAKSGRPFCKNHAR